MTKSRMMKQARHAERTEENRNTYKVFTGNHEGKRIFGRHGHRWENNIKMDLKEKGWGTWTGLIWLKIGTSEKLM
jgi:hypothetical protein